MSATVTQEQVNSVAEDLLSQGITPTVLDIKKKLEGSSMAVVWTYFQLWQQSKKLKQNQEEKILSIPENIISGINEFIQKQVHEGRSAVESELNSLRDVNDAMATEFQELKETYQRHFDELKAARSAREEVSGRFEQLNSELVRAKNEIEIEKQSAAEARKELVKIQLKLEANTRIEDDLNQLYKTLEEERVERVNAEHKVSALELKLEAEIAARKKAENDLLEAHRKGKEA